jgi:hypothetical protein
VVQESLEQLQMETLDAMLVHMPWGNTAAEIDALWRGLIEARRAEQSRAEQSRAEQSRAEQSRAEQSRAEQSRA